MSSPSPHRLRYWLCQLLGWGIYATFTGYELRVLMGTALDRSIVEPLLSALSGIVLTHGARSLMRRWDWAYLARGLFPRLLGASFALAATHVAILEGVEVALYRDHQQSVAATVGTAILRWTLCFFIWLAIYFGHAVFEQRRGGESDRRRLARALKDAELQSLRAQLNPHFLFNSLNSIRALVADEPSTAQDAITRIAKILRYTLAAGREPLVTLDRELAMVDDYLALESLRRAERLTVERRIDPGVGTQLLPVMLVQSLVENAIKHGIAELPEGGVLRIVARQSGGSFVLRVENPCPPTRRENDGRSGTSTPAAPNSTGIGLANARERLRLLFGPAASVDLVLTAGHAVSTAIVPARVAPSTETPTSTFEEHAP